MTYSVRLSVFDALFGKILYSYLRLHIKNVSKPKWYPLSFDTFFRKVLLIPNFVIIQRKNTQPDKTLNFH